MIACAGFKSASLTLTTMVTSISLPGADRMTFLAPQSMCFWQPALSVILPVVSMTRSQPRSRHFHSPGLSRVTLTCLPASRKPSSLASTRGNLPCT